MLIDPLSSRLPSLSILYFFFHHRAIILQCAEKVTAYAYHMRTTPFRKGLCSRTLKNVTVLIKKSTFYPFARDK